MNYARIHDALIQRARDRVYNSSIHHKHHIIPRHEDTSSTEVVPLTFKEHAIIHHLRWKLTGTIGNKLAYFAMKNITLSRREFMLLSASVGGKIGGATTKSTSVGIFDPTWCRATQNLINIEAGIKQVGSFTYEESVVYGQLGGAQTRRAGTGIYREDLQYLRSEWAQIGAMALEKSGNRGGICSKEWRLSNPEKIRELAATGGRIGGKIVGSMLWWNDGEFNKKSNSCPGSGWLRGLIKKGKSK